MTFPTATETLIAVSTCLVSSLGRVPPDRHDKTLQHVGRLFARFPSWNSNPGA
jgi:hypothetical protein